MPRSKARRGLRAGEKEALRPPLDPPHYWVQKTSKRFISNPRRTRRDTKRPALALLVREADEYLGAAGGQVEHKALTSVVGGNVLPGIGHVFRDQPLAFKGAVIRVEKDPVVGAVGHRNAQVRIRPGGMGVEDKNH